MQCTVSKLALSQTLQPPDTPGKCSQEPDARTDTKGSLEKYSENLRILYLYISVLFLEQFQG